MKQRPIVIYDLNGKTQVQKVQILRKLYGYRDRSNYSYAYERRGELQGIPHTREKKSILWLEDEKDLARVVEIFKKLRVNFEVGKV